MTNKASCIFDPHRTSLAADKATAYSGAVKSWATLNEGIGSGGLASPSTFVAAAISSTTSQFEQRVSELRSPRSPGALFGSSSEKSVEEILFDATANVKILTAQVAMHLERQWREKLFRQLDSLHDPDEWEPGDKPLQQSSFATFLKAMCQIKPSRRPGLGLSSSGHLIAAWTVGEDRLTVEFLANDCVRWVLVWARNSGPERFAAQTSVARLYETLVPYRPDHWFSNEKD